jgi:S-DNA-T family DNA segregation ATPase FtsK/SpoIIIE
MDEFYAEKLNNILSGLKINAKCVNVSMHRHLVFCDLELDRGAKIRNIEVHAREIGLALRSKGIPIVLTNSEKGIVSIQFATREADTLSFLDLFNLNKKLVPEGILPFLLGENGNGEPLWLDMAKNPHMLIAGGTGSGKSTLLHTIIANAVFRNDVWLYLSDPKAGVEFSLYNKYDCCNFLATDYNSTLNMLESISEEMERRYQALSLFNISSIEQNKEIFPKIMVIIDEVADLILQDQDKHNLNKGKFEHLLCSIAQKSRAAGIYIVLATQRPSVDIISGRIKANFPARIACKVSSAIDSKVILDQTGAESLLGRGDAIINSAKYNYTRFQVSYIEANQVIKNSILQ